MAPVQQRALVCQRLPGLEIKGATGQLQALRFAAFAEVTGDALEDQHIGVDTLDVEVFADEGGALGLQAQPVDPGVLGGIGLQQHQLEQRLVGGIDALEQLPVGDAEELLRGQHVQAAEVEPAIGTHEAFLDQIVGVFGVTVFLLRRHDPPQQGVAGEQDAGAIEFLKQQGVLSPSATLL